jgi:hypothetical protein
MNTDLKIMSVIRVHLCSSAAKLGLLFLLAPALFAAIDGTVVNETTGQPQAGVEVTLVHPGENGMQSLATAKSGTDGKFTIDQPLPPPPALLQAVYQGANYNLFLQPGAPTAGLLFPIYNVTTDAKSANLAEHMLMIEPTPNATRVTEVFQVQNDSKTTFLDSNKGSIQFFVPANAQGAGVSVEAPGGMPINRPPEKTAQPRMFKVSYPVKPGETTYELTYSLPPSATFVGKTANKGKMRVVTGPAVTLDSPGLTFMGQEPKLQAHIYDVKDTSFEAKISGFGLIRQDDASSGGGAAQGGQAQAQEEDNGSPNPEAGPARIYQRLYWVLGLTFGLLALGGTLLYRRSAA